MLLLQVRPPMPPTYVFLIDVSYRAVAAGILPTIADSVKGVLDGLPGGERTRVGFVTFDSSLHFYKLSPGASAPQMMVSTTWVVEKNRCFHCFVLKFLQGTPVLQQLQHGRAGLAESFQTGLHTL